jgi:hypothetical protein
MDLFLNVVEKRLTPWTPGAAEERAARLAILSFFERAARSRLFQAMAIVTRNLERHELILR